MLIVILMSFRIQTKYVLSVRLSYHCLAIPDYGIYIPKFSGPWLLRNRPLGPRVETVCQQMEVYPLSTQTYEPLTHLRVHRPTQEVIWT